MSTGWGRTCVFCKLRQGRELDVFLNLDLKNVPLMRLSPGEGSSKELMPYGDRRGLGRQKPGQISTPEIPWLVRQNQTYTNWKRRLYVAS